MPYCDMYFIVDNIDQDQMRYKLQILHRIANQYEENGIANHVHTIQPKIFTILPIAGALLLPYF